MDSKKSNKIRDIVRLQQILKKWKNKANASKSNNNSNNIYTSDNNYNTLATTTSSLSSSSSSSSTIKFLKRTLSFQDVSGAASSDAVPKGFLAVQCVGKEGGANKRFTIPTEYLSHQAFVMLLREAEEEFGFHQEGVLKIPCEVAVFEKILKMVEEKREVNYFFLTDHFGYTSDKDSNGFCFSPPSDCDLTPHHPQMCR